jgi:hypothetical protein
MKFEELGPVGPKEFSVFSTEKNECGIEGIAQDTIPGIAAKLGLCKKKRG